MTELVVVAQKIAEALAPDLVKAGARRLGREILGTPSERGMRDIYERAIAGLLVEIGETEEDIEGRPDPEAMRVAETVLGSLCSDDEASGLLLGIALRPGPVPVEALHERAEALGCEPDTLPFVFESAMWLLAKRIWEEFLAEAREDNTRIQPLINEELLSSVREHHEALRAAATNAEQGNLLPPPASLVLGRTGELWEAKRALGVGTQPGEEGGPAIAAFSSRVVAIYGWPGVGKSTFVSDLCRDRDILEHFSARVLFVPVGRSPEVRRLAEEMCAALGVPVSPSMTLDTLRSRIADALSRLSALVVFDDVWEEHHVAPLLLPSGDSAAVVVTRRLDVAARLSTGPEGPLKLGLLCEQDSLELIASRAPAVVEDHEEACRKLARALDGLPLALRVAADLLRVESEAGFDVSELLVELTEVARILGEEVPHDTGNGAEQEAEERSLTTVRTLLQKSTERLDEDTVKRFARLGVLLAKPLSFDAWTAQDVWRATADDLDRESPEGKELTRRALGDLARRGLIESAGGGIDPLAVKLDLRSKRPERFWMHALVTAFALETLGRTEGEDGVREAQQRRLEHYRRVVGAANGALSWGGDTQYFSSYLMDLDLLNIRAAYEWARVRSSEDQWALEYLSRLPTEGSRVLAGWLGAGEFLDWVTRAEKAAREIGDEDEARSHRAAIGAALLKKGQLWEALAYCEESRKAAHQSGDAVAEAAALANLASINNSMDKHEAALNLAQRAEMVLGSADAPDILTGAIGQQAKALEGLGRLPEAEERYEAQRVLAWRKGERSPYARALKGLAWIKRERPEEWDEARTMFNEAAQIFDYLKEFDLYRDSLIGLGGLELTAGAPWAAEELFGRALNSAVEDDHKVDQVRAKMNIGISYEERGTQQGYEAAEKEYRGAVTLASDSGEPELPGDVLFTLAQLLHYRMGDHQRAREVASSAAEVYQRAGSAKKCWVWDLIDEIDNSTG